jgi:hypothetical protein
MGTPDGTWLDRLHLDPATDRYITKGAEFNRISREQFADACISRYVDEVLSADPAFIATAVRHYVQQNLAETPNAADVFDLR